METSDSLAADVLGDVRVRCGGDVVTIGRGLQSTLLLFFVAHRNSVVGIDLLHATFWEGKQVANVHTAVKELRRALEPTRRRDEFEILVRVSDGYMLVLDDDDLDACRFEAAVAQAQEELAADPESARRLLKRALSLWRGRAFHEARGHGFADQQIHHLEGLRDSAQEALFEAEIRCGNAGGVIAEIESFYRDPAREDLEPRLKLRAYVELEQPRKAAAAYEAFRAAHEQEPSEEFTELYRGVLDLDSGAGQLPTFADAAAEAAVARYRRRMLGQLRHSDVRWVVGARQSGVTLHATELFTPLYVDSGPAEFTGDVGSLSLEALVAGSDRVTLIGASGSGKSTFLEHLARTAAADPKAPLPLLIRCRDLVGGAWSEQADPDWRALQGEVAAKLEREGLGLEVGDFERLAEAGQVTFLVDALNEVPKVEDRAKLAEMLLSAARRWSACKWVVTTSSTLTAESLPLGFEVAEIAEWKPEHMRRFLRSLVALSSPNVEPVLANLQADRILNRVLDHPDPVMRRLGGSPLFLTAMAVLALSGRPPAESRADLLESITSWLVKDRLATQQSLGSALQVDEVLRTLAYGMVSGEAGVSARIGRLAAAQTVEHLFPAGLDAALDFVTQAATVGGLLVPKGPGDVGFSHDLFRDYMAAKHLAGKTDGPGEDGWWSVLSQRLDDPAWRHVISFVPARLLHLGRERVDLFFERFGESSQDANFEARTRRVALGGQILRELRPLGYTGASRIPAWQDAVTGVRRLFEIPSERPDLETKYDAAVAFGREGDPRLGDREAAWAWLQGGSRAFGAQAADPAVAGYDRDAAPWEGPVRVRTVARFAIRRFPITVAEYEEFVADGGYGDLAAGLWPAGGWDWRLSLQVGEPLDWADQLAVPNAPVSGVSWFEAAAFAAWLSEREPRRGFRCLLPSEAQWEFAARRGVPARQQFPWGNRMTWDLGAEANWAGCFLRRKSPVGMFPASTTRDGVADLFGNVEEWCRDSWDEVAEPEWRIDHVPGSDHRVVRGGSTIRFSRLCRPSYRSRILAGNRYHTVGFRPVLEQVGE